MIKITVELVSAVSRERDRLLGVGLITNVSGSAQRATYEVTLSKMQPKDREAWKSGIVHVDQELVELLETMVVDFDRERRGCWDLIFIALRQLVGRRNPLIKEPSDGTKAVSRESRPLRRLRNPRR